MTVRACVFDAYGTLFDVHSAIARHRERLGDRADALSALWRAKQLEYTWLRSLMGRWINRFGQRRERLPFGPAVELKSLGALPERLGL